MSMHPLPDNNESGENRYTHSARREALQRKVLPPVWRWILQPGRLTDALLIGTTIVPILSLFLRSP